MANQLFGHELPFPRQDLYVALIAVLIFIPAVIVLNALGNAVLNLFTTKKTKTQ